MTLRLLTRLTGYLPAVVIVTLAWGAGAFGSAYPWGYVPLLSACAVIGVFALVVTVRRYQAAEAQPSLGVVSIALALVLLSVSLQLVPLPRALLNRLSPAADSLLRQYDLQYAASPSVGHALSIDPAATQAALISIAALSVFFVGLARALPLVSWRTLARGLIGLGAAVAMVGIGHRMFSAREIYGFWEYRSYSEPFAPFINRNHFGGWMLMNLPVALGYGWALLQRQRRSHRGWRGTVVWLSSPDGAEPLMVAAAAMLMAFSLVMTVSRSAILACVLVLPLIAVLARQRESGRIAAVPLVSLAAVPIVAIAWVGSADVLGRFAELPGSGLGHRIGIWRDGMTIGADFPITGIGLNAFSSAMLFYQTHDLAVVYAWAHNDYLQLAVEGGILVGIPVAVLIAVFIRTVRRRLISDPAEIRAMRAGVVTALCAIALQETVDFSLQVPGNAVLFALLCAIAVAAHPGRRFPRGGHIAHARVPKTNAKIP